MFSAPLLFLTDPVLWRKERCDFVLYWLFWIYAWAPRWPRLWGCQDLSYVQGFGSSNANTEAKDNCGSEWLCRYHAFQYSEIPCPNIQGQTQWHRAFKTRRTENGRIEVSELKRNTFVFQPISPLSAPKVQELIQILEGLWRVFFIPSNSNFVKAARENMDELRDTFPPLPGKRMPMGDVFTSCNWILRDGFVMFFYPYTGYWKTESAPKTATKRVFLITDEDNPHPGPGSTQLITSARTTLEAVISLVLGAGSADIWK